MKTVNHTPIFNSLDSNNSYIRPKYWKGDDLMKRKNITAGIITAALILSMTTQAVASEPEGMPGSFTGERIDLSYRL